MKKVLSLFLAVAVGMLLIPSFDVSADITTYVDLTPEQTLALYGNQISGSYWTGLDYEACTFNYLYTFTPNQSNIYFEDGSGAFSSSIQSYMRERKYLVYYMDSTSLVSDSVIQNDARVTLELHPSVSVSGITYFRQFIGYSIGQQQISSSYRFPAYYYSYNFISNYASFSPSPLTSNVYTWSYDPARYAWWASPVPYNLFDDPPTELVNSDLFVDWSFFDCYLQNIVDGSETVFDLTDQTLNFSGIKYVGYSQNVGNIPVRDYRYLVILSCPRVTDGYELPEQPETTPNYSGQLDDISDSLTANTTLLQQILAKLDLIYAKMNSQGISVSGTVDLGGNTINNIGVAIGSAVGSAVQGLFVPTQADILNFRLGMNTLVSDTFAPFADAQTARDLAVNRILSASPIAYVDLPLLDLRSSGVDFHIPPETFTNQGFTVQDNKVKVPLKPRENEWGTFYELLKWAIDIVCTIAFVNMLLNKFTGLIVGKKVVEIEDDN